jgi:hypothetical protein
MLWETVSIVLECFGGLKLTKKIRVPTQQDSFGLGLCPRLLASTSDLLHSLD